MSELVFKQHRRFPEFLLPGRAADARESGGGALVRRFIAASRRERRISAKSRSNSWAGSRAHRAATPRGCLRCCATNGRNWPWIRWRSICRPVVPAADAAHGTAVLNPAMLLLAYDWPVQRIGPLWRPRKPAPVQLLVYRDAGDAVRFMQLNPVTARLVALLQAASRPGGRVAGATGGLNSATPIVRRGSGLRMQVLQELGSAKASSCSATGQRSASLFGGGRLPVRALPHGGSRSAPAASSRAACPLGRVPCPAQRHRSKRSVWRTIRPRGTRTGTITLRTCRPVLLKV